MDTNAGQDLGEGSAIRRLGPWLPIAVVVVSSLAVCIVAAVRVGQEREPARATAYGVTPGALDGVDRLWDTPEHDTGHRILTMEDEGISIAWDRRLGCFRVDAPPYSFFSQVGEATTRLFRWTEDRTFDEVPPDSVEARGVARELHARLLRTLIRTSFPCGMSLPYVRIERVPSNHGEADMPAVARVSLIDWTRTVLATVDLELVEGDIESDAAFRFRDAIPSDPGSASNTEWFRAADVDGIYRPVRKDGTPVVSTVEFPSAARQLYVIGSG